MTDEPTPNDPAREMIAEVARRTTLKEETVTDMFLHGWVYHETLRGNYWGPIGAIG